MLKEKVRRKRTNDRPVAGSRLPNPLKRRGVDLGLRSGFGSGSAAPPKPQVAVVPPATPSSSFSSSSLLHG
ncbi:unnamed protein product [Caenorhabditis auriculariae]|uniref:Uncharacterized protein n=1 Tax=Caenorhabditis auriculariae TaxID=2777116 RepID=A0A8S1HJM9_9PELO|nr:unnamed protein product [Caenorhabditis auriculariae]